MRASCSTLQRAKLDFVRLWSGASSVDQAVEFGAWDEQQVRVTGLSGERDQAEEAEQAGCGPCDGRVGIEIHRIIAAGSRCLGAYALVAKRHMHEFGTTPEQLAEVAVTMRRHASLNPLAKYRDPITVEDVLNSRMISDPLHVLDCCMISDGGGAVVLSPRRARSLRKKPVWVLGHGEAVTHTTNGKRDFLRMAAGQSGPRALAMAGVTHADIDLAMLYDSFTITVLNTLGNLGFCQIGEGGAFVSGGRIALGGELPINTDGGGLSSSHSGMRGIFLIIEATHQLRWECGDRQVPDGKLALVHAHAPVAGWAAATAA